MAGKGQAKSGGRAKGAKNKATLLKEQRDKEILAAAIAEGITPLEVMLDNMRYHHNEAMQATEKLEIIAHRKEAGESAKDAAPYIHPKLASVEMQGKMEVKTTFTLDLTGDGADS